MEEFIKKLASHSTDLLLKIVIALVILVIGLKIIDILEDYLKKDHKFDKLDKSVKGFIVSFIVIGLKILLSVIVLSVVGVPMASLVTVIGSCGVAIGLALQGGLSNIAGGMMILIFKPFKVGDYIESNGKEGTVKSITLFYTTIITFDNKVIQLPNGKLSNSDITNYTYCKTRRVDINLSVAYNSNIDKVKKIVLDVINKHELILKDPEPFIRLKEHGDSALIFSLKVWTKTNDYWTVYYDLMEDIKKEFDKNKIEIPFPQMDVHMTK